MIPRPPIALISKLAGADNILVLIEEASEKPSKSIILLVAFAICYSITSNSNNNFNKYIIILKEKL